MEGMAEIRGYLKGDLRRMLSVLAAIDQLGDLASMHRVSIITHLDRRSTMSQIKQASEEAGVVIEKDGPNYKIIDWGPIIKRTGALEVLFALAKPEVQAAIEAGLDKRAANRAARQAGAEDS